MARETDQAPMSGTVFPPNAACSDQGRDLAALRLPPRAPPEPWASRRLRRSMPPAPPAPEPNHFLGYQCEAARCPVSLADMELTDAATQRLW